MIFRKLREEIAEKIATVRLDHESLRQVLTLQLRLLEKQCERLEADLREVRSTQNGMLAVRQQEGAGLAALLQEQIEPELTEEERRMQEEQKQFLSFLSKYQGDHDA